MTTAILPLTPDLWPAFEDLFGKQGACYGCWCTYFRLPPAARRDSNHERNQDHMKARVEAGPPPGLLAFEGETATGWMQIGPRVDVPEWNNKGRTSAPLDPADATDPAFLSGTRRGARASHIGLSAPGSISRANAVRACWKSVRWTSRRIPVPSASLLARRGFSRKPAFRL